jgi:hypothetical protein
MTMWKNLHLPGLGHLVLALGRKIKIKNITIIVICINHHIQIQGEWE